MPQIEPIIVQAPMGDDPPTATLYYGADCRESLRRLPDQSVHTVCTSPPYWGLRDYGNDPSVWGGDRECDHEWGDTIPGSNKGGSGTPTDKNNRGEGYGRGEPRGQYCTKCEAWLGQLGLEPDPYAFVEHLVEIFAEVKRVLRDDGTLWLNLGDSYANPGIQSSALSSTGGFTGERMRDGKKGTMNSILRAIPEGIKYKDLVGIPWMVAFALRANGWYLRADIIWAKANPMPESVTDRPTKAHEYLFLLTKGQSRKRSVTFTNVTPEFVHFGRHLGSKNTNTGTAGLCVNLATSIFDATQEKHNFSLPAFHSQEWQKMLESFGSQFSSNLPPEQRLAAYAARFLDGHISTKDFLCKIHSLWCDLAQADQLLICRRLPQCSAPPSTFVNSNAAITVNDSGHVCEIDFIHGTIIDTVPTGCNYFYDAAAIKEALEHPTAKGTYGSKHQHAQNNQYSHSGRDFDMAELGGRNKRSVWNVNTKPYRGAHFATWPEDLVEPMVLAGTGEKGCCAACGAAYKRIVEKEDPDKPYEYKAVGIPGESDGRGQRTGAMGTGLPIKSVTWEMGCECPTFGLNMNRPQARRAVEIFIAKKLTQDHLDAVRSVGFGAEDSKKSQLQTGTGKNTAEVQKLADEAKVALGSYYREFMSSSRQEDLEPPCDCPAAPLKRCVVLDPFSGSATTGKVANDHGRDYIGLDANTEYLDMAVARLQNRAAPASTDTNVESSVMDLFG